MVSSFLGVCYGPLYYRTLENEKTDMLRSNGGNLEKTIQMSRQACLWWLGNVDKDPNPIMLPPSVITLKSDSSLTSWGAVIENSSSAANGRLASLETMYHINYLEIKAILFGFKSLCTQLHDCHVKVLTDNQTAVAYLRNMGGSHSRSCNAIAREMILWCKEKNISLTISHVSGNLKKKADVASRVFHDDTEWSLDPKIFNSLVAR